MTNTNKYNCNKYYEVRWEILDCETWDEQCSKFKTHEEASDFYAKSIKRHSGEWQRPIGVFECTSVLVENPSLSNRLDQTNKGKRYF